MEIDREVLRRVVIQRIMEWNTDFDGTQFWFDWSIDSSDDRETFIVRNPEAALDHG